MEIQDDGFDFQIDEARVAAEAALDGIYVIRTSVPSERLDAAEAVRHYKRLSEVERAFRSLKTIDLKVRPIRHRLEPRVRAHIFLCMLAYYVEWHMREAWRPLLFSDEDLAAKQTRDPVAPATRSPAALRKVHRKVLDDGTPVHSFSTLLTKGESRRRSVRPVESLGGLPQRISTIRQRLGLSQRAFATRLGVSSGMIGRWERGAGVTAARLDRIATVGGVTPEWLLRGTTAAAARRRGDNEWTEAVAALEAAWREPARRRLVVRLLRVLAAEEPDAR